MFVWAQPSVQLNLPVAVSPASLANFGAYIRDIYRLHFAHEVAAGTRKLFVLPYAVLGSFLLPVLYLSIPHVRRPWLYHARWPLMAFIVAFNCYQTWTTSSANFAIGYAVGLMQAWGILWSATLLVWMSPQFDAERVDKRRRAAADCPAPTVNGNGHVAVHANGDHRHQPRPATPPPEKVTTEKAANRCEDTLEAPDEDVARSLRAGYEYYWQAYPADAPFSKRLEWSLDLYFSFRGTGWNWCVPILPQFAKPEKPLSGALVDLSSIPLVTRQGYRRYRTNTEWLRSQVFTVILSYLVLDLLSTLMMKDPYFILGPEFSAAVGTVSRKRRAFGLTAEAVANPIALPPILAALPPVLLYLYRSMLCFAAVMVGINLIFTCWQFAAHFIVPRALIGGSVRGELWHYPSVYGNFVACVLDKGVAGFWGGWWHQTFRTAFAAPGIWMAKKGWINPRSAGGKAVAGFLAFAQSGFLHSLGSVSCLPPSKPWLPPAFFILCWVGVLVQQALTALLRSLSPSPSPFPTWLSRTANFCFCFVYLVSIQFLLCDDLGRSAIWLLEPVPASVFRLLGMGKPGDSWWRWDPSVWPKWHAGGWSRWWETGMTL